MNSFLFFVNKPERLMLVAAAFWTLYAMGIGFFWVKGKKFRRLWPTLVLGCLWFACGLWEQHCVIMEYNIRADLVFLIPLMYGLTMGLIFCQITLLMLPQNPQ